MKRQKKRREITPLHLIAFLALFTVAAPYLLYLLVIFIARAIEIANDIDYYLLVLRSLALIGGAITAFFAVWFFVLPIILFIFRRIKCYFQLYTFCLKRHFKIKLTRFPFTSLFGPASKADIKIRTTDGDFSIHFIDIIFRAHRGFTLISDKEYSISKRSTKVGLWGGSFIRGGLRSPITTAYTTTETSLTVYAFPEFDTKDSRHIIIVNPSPNHLHFVDRTAGGDGKRELYSGYSIGDITYYSIRGFLKFLKRI